MNRHIHVLWRKTEVLEGVQDDGWEVDASHQNSLSAGHREAVSVR